MPSIIFDEKDKTVAMTFRLLEVTGNYCDHHHLLSFYSLNYFCMQCNERKFTNETKKLCLMRSFTFLCVKIVGPLLIILCFTGNSRRFIFHFFFA